MDQDRPRTFLTALGAVAAIAAVAMVAVNVVVDPFWRFDLVTIEGFNKVKPQVTHQFRLAKAHQVCRLAPENVILGSSRVELGFDPTYEALASLPGATYNLAMAGTGIWELDQTLRHAFFASGRLKVAIAGLDFYMFNANREAVVFETEVINFDKKRLLLSERASCLQSFLYDVDMLMGVAGLVASWRTAKT
jgi:hypothetical protein